MCEEIKLKKLGIHVVFLQVLFSCEKVVVFNIDICFLWDLNIIIKFELISMTNLTRFESDQKKIDTGIGRPKCFGYMGKNKFPNTFCNGDYL